MGELGVLLYLYGSVLQFLVGVRELRVTLRLVRLGIPPGLGRIG